MLFSLFGKPSQVRFARMMTKAVRKAGFTGPLRFDEAEFRLVSGTPDRIFHLSNAYTDYCKSPWNQRRNALRKYAGIFTASTSEISDSFVDAREQLLPNLRDVAFYGNLALVARVDGTKGIDAAHTRFAEHLAIEVVRDTPEFKSTVPFEHLHKWGVSLDEAMAIARDNLWKISNEPFRKLGDGTYVSDWQDTYDASRLFLHDLIWQLEVKGQHVVTIPSRDFLFVTGSDDEQGLAMVAEWTDKVFKEDTRPLTGMAYRLEGKEWKPYLPPPAHPGHAAYCRLHFGTIARDYGEQKVLLEKVFNKEKRDIFVATYMLMEGKTDKEVKSFSAWTLGVDTLLPRTGIVMVGRPQSPGAEKIDILGQTSWVQVESLGLLEQEAGLEPPRYRPALAVSDEQIAALHLEGP